VRGTGNSPKALLETLEKNYCKLSNKEEDLIQSGAFQIYKSVNDFNAFYTFVGMK
jgi:DNA-directed RNA polymerase specialized sigma subunit